MILSIMKLSLLTLMLIFVMGGSKAGAAELRRPEISLTPSLQSVQIDSNTTGKPISVSFSNDSKETQELTLSIADFGSLNDTGGVAFAGSDFGKKPGKYQLSPWLKLDQDKVTLEPGKKVTINAVISESSSMAAGGHYAAIIATVLSADGKDKTQVNVKQKISSLIFATKTGGEKYDLGLQEVESNGSWRRLPSEVYVGTKATGNMHVVPRGIVYLKDKSGKVVKKGVINVESGLILPETKRTFTVNMNNLSSPKFWKRNFYLQVDYRYDGQENYASSKVKVTYTNVRAYIFIAVVLSLVAWMTNNYLSYDTKLPTNNPNKSTTTNTKKSTPKAKKK